MNHLIRKRWKEKEEIENIVVYSNENIVVIRNGEVDTNKLTKLLLDVFIKYINEEENASSNDCLKH